MVRLKQCVTQGFKAMPPRGLCMDCSTEDYQAVIDLMVSKPGR
ncbi:cytochrome C [Pseudomonas azotoformans]|uniref:Cytochrome C n=1 Tax=Pseudomonas azotoformans TaxID=47878 RepID=A0A4Q0HUR7_PSEAZ|nr:cytochrome C [Pseudomonas azotoformans]